MFGALKKMMVRKVGELEAKLTLYSQPFQEAGVVGFIVFSDGTVTADAKLGYLGEAKTKRVVVRVDNTSLFPVTGTLGFVGCKDVEIHKSFAGIIKAGSRVMVTVDDKPYAAGLLKVD